MTRKWSANDHKKKTMYFNEMSSNSENVIYFHRLKLSAKRRDKQKFTKHTEMICKECPKALQTFAFYSRLERCKMRGARPRAGLEQNKKT